MLLRLLRVLTCMLRYFLPIAQYMGEDAMLRLAVLETKAMLARYMIFIRATAMPFKGGDSDVQLGASRSISYSEKKKRYARGSRGGTRGAFTCQACQNTVYCTAGWRVKKLA